MNIDDFDFVPVLHKLLKQQEAAFQKEQERTVRDYIVKQCEKIRKYVPEFTGCSFRDKDSLLNPWDITAKVTEVSCCCGRSTSDVTFDEIASFVRRDLDCDGVDVKLPMTVKKAIVELSLLSDAFVMGDTDGDTFGVQLS